MKNSLEALFGSRERWRLIKMFLLNEDDIMEMDEIAKRSKINSSKLRSLVTQLANVKFILARKQRGRRVYVANKKFPFFWELKNLVVKSNIFPQCESLEKIKKLGNVKLAIISGVFLNHPKSKTDLLVVGDNLSRAKLRHLLNSLEAEMGREVDYCLMDMTEFKYRTNMFDKFIVELMESPHEIVVNKISSDLYQLMHPKKAG